MKLFHLSENENIEKFIPRESKTIWNFEKYVWAINEDKIQNYLFPRECPRICISNDEAAKLKTWISEEASQKFKSHVFVSESWKTEIENCMLYKYEFDESNFKAIDEIAGYFVSKEIEIPISKKSVINLPKVHKNLFSNLKYLSKEQMIDLRKEVIEKIKNFSIIKWDNI